MLGLLAGCGKGDAPKADAEPPPPEVQVGTAVVHDVRDYEEFTGRLEAEKSVEVRTRVSGFLWEIKFKDGAEVNKDDILFEIDPRPYKSQHTRDLGQLHLAEATLQQNQAGLLQARATLQQMDANQRQMEANELQMAAGKAQAAANLQTARNDLKRAEELKKTDGAISTQDWDKAVQSLAVAEAQSRAAEQQFKAAEAQKLAAAAQKAAAEAQIETARAMVKSAEAQIETATAAAGGSKILLDWTTVRAPISGVIGRRMLDKMSLVQADQTLLTTIVALDEMYVYFDVDERTLIRLRQEATAADPGADDTAGERERPGTRVDVGLAGEEGFSLHGNVDFEDNRVDPGTGTIRLRAVIKNKRTPAGTRLLSPGLFARVRLTIGGKRKALLVNDRALGTDQGKKFLYVVVDKPDPATKAVKHVVERRYVLTGDMHDGLREIRPDPKVASGQVNPGDRIVVAGLQRIRPGIAVKPLPAAEKPHAAPAGGEGGGGAPAAKVTAAK